jgi:hypothetical protein
MPLFRRADLTLLVAVCVLQLSCRTPQALEYREFNDLVIDKLGFNTSTVKMNVFFFNPNNFGLQLKRADLDIYVEDNLVGHATEILQMKIPRRDTFAMPVQVDVDMKNIYRNAYTSLLKQQVLVKVTGTVQVGKANIFITFPVNYQGIQPFKLFN